MIWLIFWIWIQNSLTLLSSSFRCQMIHLTLQSRGRSPAWSPSSCGGFLAGRSSYPHWCSDRQSSTTVIVSQSQTQSLLHHVPPHFHYAPHLSSPSPLLTQAGRIILKCVFVLSLTKCFSVELIIRVKGQWSSLVDQYTRYLKWQRTHDPLIIWFWPYSRKSMHF